MKSREPFDELRRRLAAERAPAEYVRQLVEELRNDVRESEDAGLGRGLSQEEAHAAAMEQIGSDRDIADVTLNTLRRESWLGRHQVGGLMMAAVVVFPVAVILLDLIPVVCAFEIGRHYHRDGVRALDHVLKWMVEVGCNLVIPGVCLWALWRVWRGRYCKRALTRAAVAVACIWSVAIEAHVYLPQKAGQNMRGDLGIYVGWTIHWPYPRLPLMLLMVWLVGWILIRRRRRAVEALAG